MKKILAIIILTALSLQANAGNIKDFGWSSVSCNGQSKAGEVYRVYINVNDTASKLFLHINNEVHEIAGGIKNKQGLYTKPYETRQDQTVYLSIARTDDDFYIAQYVYDTEKQISIIELECHFKE